MDVPNSQINTTSNKAHSITSRFSGCANFSKQHIAVRDTSEDDVSAFEIN